MTESQKTETKEIMQEEEPPKIFLGSIEIASTIKSSQNQNGLKHQDYKRYRRYCTKRIKRIRKGMKFSYGKGKYQKKRIEKERPENPRILEVLLFNSERCWAYAMDLKQSYTNQKMKDNRRIKMAIRKKFKSSMKWAKLLAETCQNYAEKKSALEAEAYSEYMFATYNFEFEEWEKCLNSLIKSRQIYEKLKTLSDPIQTVFYNEKIDQIDQSIRYCNHKEKGLNTMGIEEIINLKGKNQDPLLNAKVDAMLDELRGKKPESESSNLELFGESLPIKNEKISILLEKVKESKIGLKRLESSAMILEEKKNELSNYEERLGVYTEIFSFFDEAIKLAAKEKDESKDNEGLHKIHIKILTCLNLKKLEILLERNLLQLQTAKIRFARENSLYSVQQQKRNQKIKLITPHEMVRWCDNYLQSLKQTIEIERDNPDKHILMRYETTEKFIKNHRCFFIAGAFFTVGKHVECLSLLEYLESNIEQLLKEKSSDLKLGFDMVQESNVILAELRIMKARALYSVYEKKTQEDAVIEEKMVGLNLEGKKASQKSLLALLTESEAGKKVDINLEKIKDIPIIELPPKPVAISCIPISFDLGFNYLRYPAIEKKIKEEKQGFLKKAINTFNIFKKN